MEQDACSAERGAMVRKIRMSNMSHEARPSPGMPDVRTRLPLPRVTLPLESRSTSRPFPMFVSTGS